MYTYGLDRWLGWCTDHEIEHLHARLNDVKQNFSDQTANPVTTAREVSSPAER